MPRVVVITGMARSGTSLAASMLQRAGLDVGGRLIDPGRSNPQGYFEDADFVDFHERAFRSRGTSNLAGSSFHFEPTAAEIDRAEQIIATRRGRELWSFKDPRASLFLDFWDARLEDAVYFFLFRHPLDVLMSLLRYGEARAAGIVEPIREWEARNARILQFRARNPERCAIVHSYGFENTAHLNNVLRTKLGLDIAVTPEIIAQLYRPAELHSCGRGAERAFALIEPGAAEMYTELGRVADIGPPEQGAAEEPESLASFGRVANELLPVLGASRRGLLLLLTELVAPDIAEHGLTAQLRYILDLEEGKEWLEEQWKALQRPGVLTRIRRMVGRSRVA